MFVSTRTYFYCVSIHSLAHSTQYLYWLSFQSAPNIRLTFLTMVPVHSYDFTPHRHTSYWLLTNYSTTCPLNIFVGHPEEGPLLNLRVSSYSFILPPDLDLCSPWLDILSGQVCLFLHRQITTTQIKLGQFISRRPGLAANKQHR